jgi:hypothetical protein
VTSIGAKDPGAAPGDVTHLATSGWSVPWQLTGVDASFHALGGQPKAYPTSDVPRIADGPTAVDSAQDWISFSSLAAAMAVDVPTLLANARKARQGGDQLAYGYMASALRAKNPSFEATLTVVKTDATIGRDLVRFWIGMTGHDVTRKLNDGESVTLTFDLNDVADPAAIDDSEAHLNVLLNPTARSGQVPAGEPWVFPFADASRTFPVATGSYRVDVKRK